MFISSDENTPPIVQKIIQLYPNANIIEMNEINTIQFASTCKHIVLSHGSFSAIIGYLSFFSGMMIRIYIFRANYY